MCGIAGIVSKTQTPPERALLETMVDALRHRGPDGSRLVLYGRAAIGQSRLAIVDLENGGHPISAGSEWTLVGNGEIYNAPEIRSEQLSNASLSTRGDFEPLLRLIAERGFDAISAARGMYAVALYRQTDQSLTLARDPFGIKPLYYLDHTDSFSFASEIGPLASRLPSPPEILREKQHELLQCGSIGGRETIFQGVHRVLPGERLRLAGGRLMELPRSDPSEPRPAPVDGDFESAIAAFDSLFEDSVRIHLRADVPVGVFLSSGLDSTAILSMMRRLTADPITTFTCGFDDRSVPDERAVAARTAAALGAENTAVSFTESDFTSLLPFVAEALDDPITDYATLPTFKLAQVASRSMKVILSGEGGDEALAGYWRNRQPPVTGAGAIPGHFDRLPGVLRDDDGSWRKQIAARRGALPLHDLSPIQQTQAIDIAGWLHEDLLVKLDRCLMRHGVEGRTPFLDARLTPFCLALADDLKVRGDVGKYLLRCWLERHGPAEDYRAPKRGFTVPVGEWIRRSGRTLGELVAANPAVGELAHPAAVRALFTSEGQHEILAAWRLLFYAVWHRVHVERVRPIADLFEFLR